MSDSLRKIHEYFIANPNVPEITAGFLHFLTWNFANLLKLPQHLKLKQFSEFVLNWISADDSAFDTWKELKNNIAQLEIDVDNLITELIFYSFDVGASDNMEATLEKVALKAKSPDLLFQSAFVAFNNNHARKAISLLEKINHNTSQTLVLKSQALQDLEDFEEAYICLCEATELNPLDTLAWFHLARLAFAQRKNNTAWDAIGACSNQLEQNIEISELKLMIGLEKYKNDSAKKTDLFNDALAKFRVNSHNYLMFETWSTLCLTYGDEGWFKELCNATDFRNIVLRNYDLKYLADILRELNSKKWYDSSVILNDKIQKIIRQSDKIL